MGIRPWLAAGTAAVACASLAAPSYAINKPTTLKLSEAGGGSIVVDRGQIGHSVGDTIAFSHGLLNRTRQLSRPSGARVGVSRGVCQVLHVDKRRLCTWQLDFSNGTVLLTGIVRVTAWSPLAIVGGTGAYANSRGDATRHRVSGNRIDWSVRLHP